MNASTEPAPVTPLWRRYQPSQATLVAAALGLALLFLFFANWAVYRNQPQRVAWSDYMQWPQFLAMSILWSAICVMTYWLVQLWHEALPSDDASIESAWQAGLKSMRARGQSLDQVPLFLVLGDSERLHQKQLLEQSGLHLMDDLIPADPDAPLHWAFSDQGVWLFVQGAGTYACVSKRLAVRSVEPAWHDANLMSTSAVDLSAGSDGRDLCAQSSWVQSSEFESECHVATDVYQDQASLQVTRASIVNSLNSNDKAEATPSSGTTMATSTLATSTLAVSGDSVGATGFEGHTSSASRSTIASASDTLDGLEELLSNDSQAESVFGDSQTGQNPSVSAALQSAQQTALAFQSAAQPAVLTSTEITRRQHALQEICRRLRSQRRNIAPANGVVAIVPSQQLLNGSVVASELGLALRSDLQVVQDEWQQQAPINIVVDGFELLPGTRELVRRGGPESARVDSLGAAFPVRYQPEKSLLSHTCKLAVGQLEARIYRQLRSFEGSMTVGNRQLFELLIACRSRLLPALETITGEAVGRECQGESAREPFLFAGIHFVASGQKVTEQAWARAALSNVHQSQNFLRWTNQRMRSERKLLFAISCFKACCLILVVSLIGALFL